MPTCRTLLVLVIVSLELLLAGCSDCLPSRERVPEVLLDTSGVIAAGEQQPFGVNNGIRRGNLLIVLTWTDPSVALSLKTFAHDCDPVTNGACGPSGGGFRSGTRVELELDASSIPRYTITVVGDLDSASDFTLTVYYEPAC